MFSMRERPRSSDPDIDCEQKEVWDEIEELTHTERTYQSPQEEESKQKEYQTAFAFTFPERRLPSRSNSRTSQMSDQDKITVFKDEASPKKFGRTRKLDAHIATKKIPTMSKSRGQVTTFHARSKSHSAIQCTQPPNPPLRATALSLSNDTDSTKYGYHTRENSYHSRITLGLVKKLQQIAAQRSQLVQKLNALTQAEDDVLSQLLQLQSTTLLHSASTVDENSISLPSLRPIIPTEPPVIPSPINKIPNRHPSKASRKPTHSRTSLTRSVSASNSQNCSPVGLSHHIACTSRRTPLVDKTETSIDIFDSARSYAEGEWNTLSVEPSNMLPGTKEACSGEVGATPSWRGTSRQVQTKFGDEEQELLMHFERSNVRPNTPCSRIPRQRGRPATPAPTPYMSQYYEGPHATTRKRWDF